MPSRLLVALISVFVISCACAKVPGDPQASASKAFSPLRDSPRDGLRPLFSHIWRLTKAPTQPAAGAIYIFLANGTVLESSCVETYRIATWSVDKSTPRELDVVEDRQPAFTANITDLSDTTLHIRQQFVRTKESRDLTFNAVEGEFVCPDLPK
jgi:hypothetical protein